jgi:hypothetical protein
MSLTPDHDSTGSRPRVSELALELHMMGALASLATDHAGRVGTDLLDRMSIDTSTAAVELELAGLWRRDGTGYQIDEAELHKLVKIIDEQLLDLADDCTRRGGHLMTAEQPGYCARCMSPL